MKLDKVNDRQLGENSPNPVTLMTAWKRLFIIFIEY
jgi:hypothetical protein